MSGAGGSTGGRVVVFGEYPPFFTPGAAATLATVRSLLEAGREIEVVSPQPSAAHHYADPGNPRGAARLARLARGAELVARLDPGILGQSGGRGPAAARAATGLAVRGARSAAIFLSPLTAAPAGKWVRSILGPAERVVVASQEDADRLRAAGLDSAKLSIAEEPWWLPPAPDAAAPGDDGESTGPREAWNVSSRGASREEVEAEVRRRAAQAREEEATSPQAAAWPLQMLTPLAPAPTESSQPLFRLIKRYVHRLVAWEIVPIVEQVNHLHRATLESFGRQAEATQAGIDASSGAAVAPASAPPPAKNR
ncbi:MAG TPA: hypothetical protein VEG38_00470 [Acidimicrobiia bacterium]|nr:hypothetical protein [Acidimicrobiia bacterium]